MFRFVLSPWCRAVLLVATDLWLVGNHLVPLAGQWASAWLAFLAGNPLPVVDQDPWVHLAFITFDLGLCMWERQMGWLDPILPNRMRLHPPDAFGSSRRRLPAWLRRIRNR